MDTTTAAICVYHTLSVGVLIDIVFLSTIHYIKENLKLIFFYFLVAPRYLTLEKLYGMRNK